MSLAAFEELDYAQTVLGELTLRRREVLSLDRAVVYEVKLDGQFLMSSLVNDAEIALANEALPLVVGDPRDVLVGGLGLGYTARAALDFPGVNSVTVAEFLEPVLDWHRRGLVPLGRGLVEDPRCQLLHADFFALVGSPPEGAAVADPDGRRRFHAILLDIDHSPQALLQPGHAAFYRRDGLQRLAAHLHDGAVFALWSADPPTETFLDDLAAGFAAVDVRTVSFINPLLNREDTNHVIIARHRPG